MSSVRFGISPLTWTNDDMPSLGGDIPLEKCLSEMSEVGFVGTEMGTKYPREPEQLALLLNSHKLKLAAGWYSGNLMVRSVAEEIEAAKPHIELLKACGCSVMVMGEVSNSVHSDIDTPLSQRVILSDAQWKEYGKKLTEFADYVQQSGVQLGYHNHMGMIVETVADIDKLVEVTGPSVTLTLDTGHIMLSGGDAASAVERFADRIVHVHTKDVRKDVKERVLKEDMSFLNAVLEGVFTVPGDGCIDFDGVMQVLKTKNYDGWVLVEAEQDPKIYNPFEYATLALKNLNLFAQKAGVTVN